MGLPTPEDNLEGYNNSDVTRIVEGFRGKEFYLLHGNADDNVHYLQAMVLSRALELSNILFRQQVSTSLISSSFLNGSRIVNDTSRLATVLLQANSTNTYVSY
jgi:hypothetical protein